MNFYMVRDKKTGLFYKRIYGRSGSPWEAQEDASVWTTRKGAASCFGAITQQNARSARRFGPSAIREPEIVTLMGVDPASGPSQSVTVGFVDCDDWEGLYINGRLIEQSHHIRLDEVLAHLGIKCVCYYPDDAWLEERGDLPENLDDVKTA